MTTPDKTTFLAALAALLICLSTCRTLTAQESAPAADVIGQVDEAMGKLGDEGAQFVKSDKEAGGEIAIGTFTGPAGATAGPKMVKMLKEHLQEKCKVVTLGSAYSISGNYFVKKDETKGQLVIVIDAKIFNRLGAPHLSLRRKIVTDLSAAPKLFGLVFDASQAEEDDPPAADKTEKKEVSFDQTDKKPAEKSLRKSGDVAKVLESSFNRDKPALDVDDGVVVKASEQSPYGLEIVEQTAEGNYKAIPVDGDALASGVAKVQINPENPFAVRIHNRGTHLVGVDLTLDGINVFEFSQNPFWKQLGKMVIQPGVTTIKGWHDQGDHSFAFLVTNYGASAAASLGVTEEDTNLGTITATFYEIVPPGSRNFGIGKGERVTMRYDANARPVQFGGMIGAVSIKYNRQGHPADLPPPE